MAFVKSASIRGPLEFFLFGDVVVGGGGVRGGVRGDGGGVVVSLLS